MRELLAKNSQSEDDDDDFNYNNIDKILRSVIFILTAYLFFGEFYILVMNAWYHDKNKNFKIFFSISLFNLFLHYFVMHNVWEASDERIQ